VAWSNETKQSAYAGVWVNRRGYGGGDSCRDSIHSAGLGPYSSRAFGAQPMIIVFSDGMIFRSAEKRLLAKVALRRVRGSMTFIWTSPSRLRSRYVAVARRRGGASVRPWRSGRAPPACLRSFSGTRPADSFRHLPPVIPP
jgi:hypothetical protein